MAGPTTGGIAATRQAQARLGLVLVAPAVVLVVTFFLFPLGSAAYYSLTSWDGAPGSAPFVGLANYTEMLGDGQVWHALLNNGTWIVIGTGNALYPMLKVMAQFSPSAFTARITV